MHNLPNVLFNLPQELIILIVSAVPIIEVRGAVPLGIAFGLHPILVFLLSVIGSILPALPLLLFLEFGTKILRKYKSWDNFFVWLFNRTKAKSKIIEEMEMAGLIIFIGIPLPGTGVWTGMVAAYLLRLSWWKSLFCATIGTMIASFIMLIISLGIKFIF